MRKIKRANVGEAPQKILLGIFGGTGEKKKGQNPTKTSRIVEVYMVAGIKNRMNRME